MEKACSTKLVALVLWGAVFAIGCQKPGIKEAASAEQAGSQKNPAPPGFVTDDMVLTWNTHLTNFFLTVPQAPPVVSRHATMAQIAVYDALNSIKPKYEPYAQKTKRFKFADPNAAVASATYHAIIYLDEYLKQFSPATPQVGFPLTSLQNWNNWYAQSMTTVADGDAKQLGIEAGKEAASAIVNLRASDGYAQARFVYAYAPIPAQPIPAGVWRPTIFSNPPINPPAGTTHTGGLASWAIYMKSFSGMRANQFAAPEPPSLQSARYTTDFNEVKTLGNRAGSNVSQVEYQVANFWQESPALIWNRVAHQSLVNKKMDAWKSARLLALVNAAIFDGLLASFESIYAYKRWRPETAIRLADQDGNDDTTPTTDWLPRVTDIKLGAPPNTPTPPIPEYPNTGTALGEAAAEAMRQFYGTDATSITLVSKDVIGATVGARHFSSFTAASNDYGLSRIYAGFAFRYSIEAGIDMGNKTGKYVAESVFREMEN
jgi:hypothetical protein